VFEGSFWSYQAINDILPAWTEHARDEKFNTFYAYLDRRWTPYETRNRFPGMLARHIFSYSAAYMMSGNEQHLNRARQTMKYLIRYGWDEKYGLWYNEIDSAGNPVDRKKDLFMQTYAVTGLSMYFVATHDSTALHYIERSNSLLEKHAWDQKFGGYYRSLNRDLSVDSTNQVKEFTPQLAPLSGHLLYLYAATRDTAYLRQSRRIFDTALNQMYAGPQNWIMERFRRDWTYMKDNDKNRAMNVGHNVETSWLGLRMFQLTSDEKYLDAALQLADSLDAYALKENGAWYHRVDYQDPHKHPRTTPWWVQAYGNMFQLYLFRMTGANEYLNQYKKGAQFWNQHFLDEEYGGVVLSTYVNGAMDRGDKAVRSKTSYHALEHSLLNYIYLNLWIQNEEVVLYYNIRESAKSGKLYPLPIEEFTYQIKEVIINGENWNQIDREGGYIELPEKGPAKVKVTIRDNA
jgi:mannobiose 2-epimerase